VVATAFPRRGQAELAFYPCARSFSTLLFVDLDVAARYGPSITVGEIIWSGYAHEKRVLARTRISIITGVYRVPVTGLLVDLSVALEGSAVA